MPSKREIQKALEELRDDIRADLILDEVMRMTPKQVEDSLRKRGVDTDRLKRFAKRVETSVAKIEADK